MKIDKIVEEFILGSQKFYPRLEFSERRSMYSGDEPASCTFEFGLRSKNLTQTAYDTTGLKYLIHYTPSIQNVVEVLNSGVFRLSNLTSMNDPQEVVFANNYLENAFSKEQMNEFKANYFSASFCSVENNSNGEEFSMWRL